MADLEDNRFRRDAFTERLEATARSLRFGTAIEFGAVPGGGTTEALSAGLSNNGDAVRLFLVARAKSLVPALRNRYADLGFAYTYGTPAVKDELPLTAEVAQYFVGQPASARSGSLLDTLNCLVEARQECRLDRRKTCALDQIRKEFGALQFDLVVIDGSEFAAAAELKHVYGAKHVFVTGTASFAGNVAWRRMMEDVGYELLFEDASLRSGAAIFEHRKPKSASDLPVHFLTIVLNGEPWIRYHERVFRDLPFPWVWHIVEGVASLVHDTSWSVASGGRIVEQVHRGGRSKDGTSEYLDDLARRFPDNVKVYRKPIGQFWDGKREMVNAPIEKIAEDCVLWQVDSDEIWTADQIVTMQRLFSDDPSRTAAWFWCKYFVGAEKAIATRYNYAQNPNQEWLRAWRFRPGMRWVKHEPPVLGRQVAGSDEWEDIGRVNPFLHDETEAHGLVFEHYAYVTRAQAEFKETYYGYAGAVQKWKALQDYSGRPRELGDFLDWVPDNTIVADIQRLRWTPIATTDPETGRWSFRSLEQRQIESRAMQAKAMTDGIVRVLVDAVYFQLIKGGIGRLWLTLIEEWKKSGFIDNVVVLDRGGTCPRVEGVTYRSIKPHRIVPVEEDAAYLQRICDEESADLFVSTYYTTPTRTPTIFMGYDMIPEVIGVGLEDPWWQQKRRAIQYAAGHVMISHSSAHDLVRFFPGVPRSDVVVAFCSVADVFHKATEAEVAAFRQAHGLPSRYVIMVGERRGWQGYKNGILAFAGIAKLDPAERPLMICVGGAAEIEPEYRELLPDSHIRKITLDDDGLRAAFTGAHALIYPSLYEGFGLPIAEAIACECPVITCANSSIPEVGGDGVLYVDPQVPQDVADAIRRLYDPAFRAKLIAAGLKHIQRFNAAESARKIAALYLDSVARMRKGALHDPAMALDDVLKLIRKTEDLELQRQQAEQAKFDAKNGAATLEACHRQQVVEMQQRVIELENALQAERNHLHRLKVMQLSPFWKAREATVSTLRRLRLRERT